jgi:Uncharacterized protein conserved in bacteria (DUF2255)
MATSSKEELRKIAEADDLHIAPFRDDGVTYGTPTWIWSVAVDDALYDIAACEAEGRITALRPEPGVSVHTAWDIGHRHSTAIWFFQVVGPEVRIIDFYENHGQYVDHYCSVVSARGYLQGKDFVPHDARVHEWGSGKTRLETLIALGRKPVLVPEHKIEDGQRRAHDVQARLVRRSEVRARP